MKSSSGGVGGITHSDIQACVFVCVVLRKGQGNDQKNPKSIIPSKGISAQNVFQIIIVKINIHARVRFS